MQHKAPIKLPFLFSFLDYPDPLNSSLVIYTVGCNHRCPLCQNPELTSVTIPDAVYMTADDIAQYASKQVEHSGEDMKIVFSGGDPLYYKNFLMVNQFCMKFGNSFDICIYTGFDVKTVKLMGLSGFKFLKCGRYDEDQKQRSSKDDYKFVLASKNQELYGPNYELLSDAGVYYFTSNRSANHG